MSGTSLDGLDIAFVSYERNNSRWNFSVLNATTIKYSEALYKQLSDAIYLNGLELCHLDSIYGQWLGSQINAFIKEHNIHPDFIASHGHTIFHQPEKGFTYQIGNGHTIHALTKIPVIYNFRNLDVALRGQGAPLVPVGDHLLFSDYNYCLNIGGIANISYTDGNDVRAFDVCPANMVLNMLAARKGKQYDDKGKMAVKGQLIEPLLNKLEKVSTKSKGPHSLGYEEISEKFFPMLDESYVVEDLLHTYNHYIVKMVSEAVDQLGGKSGKRMLVTGGGAYNDFLMTQLHEHCSDLEIVKPESQLVSFKEAIIFGFLGILRLEGENNVYASVTGAQRDSCSGDIVGHIKEKC